MEKEKSIRVSESTYKMVKELAKRRSQTIKVIVRLAVEYFKERK